MIVELLLNLLKAFLLFIIGLFPKLPSFAFLGNTVNVVVNVILAFDHFVDIGVVGFCISLLFVFTHIEFVWGIVMWVIRKIPGVT